MFKTIRAAEMLVGNPLGAGELQFWPFVEFETFLPWFHVETIEDTGDALHKGVILAASVDQLKQFLQHDCQTAWIEEVQVITPGDLNGTGSWRMEILTKLTEFNATDSVPSGHTYEVHGGATYSTAITEAMEKTVSNLVYARRT
ncbi:hypothetical protein [Pseudomonas sp. Pseu.R1]|uniref:hypothetical protein n=1 Tax=Pseudomonas sp. Pseu.R1 TaxID=3379818 RepID=UPI003B933916